MRIKFKKNEEREFLKKVLENLNCPSLKELSNRVGINYSSLKNYFNEERTLPENLFNDLCYISQIDKKTLDVEFLDENYGRVIGGKKGKR